MIPDMVVFETIRNEKGGGTLIACHKDLKPKLVEEYDDEENSAQYLNVRHLGIMA